MRPSNTNKDGLGTCAQALRFPIPCFQANGFTHVPCTTSTPTVHVHVPS